MRAPALSARLLCVHELVPEGAAVADVGAGHGTLAAHLVNRCRRVIATEAASGPAAELRHNLARWEIDDQVEVRHGAGLDPLRQGEVDVVVVAGMGARRLLRIARDAPRWGVARLVLQCVQDPELIEPWLAERGWPVDARCLALDRGRSYPTWSVVVQ